MASDKSSTEKPIGICILGATGSIGLNTLDVISRHPDKYRIVALTANTQVNRLYDQCVAYQPNFAVMVDIDCAQKLKEKLTFKGLEVEVLSGNDGLEYVASLAEVQYVMAAIVGAAGLRPTLAAAKTGKRIMLANKEALVMSGNLFMDELARSGAELLPIDSEHNAIFQCMPSSAGGKFRSSVVEKILLTASGGPFLDVPISDLDNVTPEQACDHPNWKMGKKISVDSATMMNKGLEVIEACYLFNVDVEDIQVVVHPQSIIHSMVAYVDGSVIAQLGNPDMRTPIAYALGWPERIESGVEHLDIFSVGYLNFKKPDLAQFPCLGLAVEAMREGGTCTTILNAANEIAVQAFLDNKLKFTDIPYIIERTMEQISKHEVNSLDDIIKDDQIARLSASEHVSRSL
jgi:1-deoxy-D-xylulose-5-phosphate reductoisomerase